MFANKIDGLNGQKQTCLCTFATTNKCLASRETSFGNFIL